MTQTPPNAQVPKTTPFCIIIKTTEFQKIDSPPPIPNDCHSKGTNSSLQTTRRGCVCEGSLLIIISYFHLNKMLRFIITQQLLKTNPLPDNVSRGGGAFRLDERRTTRRVERGMTTS